jgi:hypothetical protein
VTCGASPIDVIFLDPPRAGAEAICREMERWNPTTILYVNAAKLSQIMRPPDDRDDVVSVGVRRLLAVA